MDLSSTCPSRFVGAAGGNTGSGGGGGGGGGDGGLTAARASTYPAPHRPAQLDPDAKDCAVACSVARTRAGVSVGSSASMRATVPDTCGAAIEVPL